MKITLLGPIKAYAIAEVVSNAVVKEKCRQATKYISEKLVIRATRKTYSGKIIDRGNIEILLTIGRPNWQERRFIRACKQAGEPFPVRKIQLKFLPKKSKK